MQQTEWVSETADVDCSRWTVCITSTERLFWVNEWPSDSKHFLYNWVPVEWRTSTYRDVNGIKEMPFFLSLLSFNHGLSIPTPCCSNHPSCVCVFPDVRGLVAHCPILISQCVSRCGRPGSSSDWSLMAFKEAAWNVKIWVSWPQVTWK